MNPVIKFTTLFGLLAVELAVALNASTGPSITRILAGTFSLTALVFVLRSFYGTRIRSEAPYSGHAGAAATVAW
jgi:K(+)-stimulated pyrophosphate-energized sodium pump